MKLTGIAIDGYRKLTNIRLMQISPSMNLVYGEKGTGKTRVADFIQGILYGPANVVSDTNVDAALSPNEPIEGTLQIQTNAGQCVLKRDLHTGNRLNVSPAILASGDAQNMISGSLDRDLFDNIFSVSFDTRCPQYSIANSGLAQTLNRRLGVGIGQAFAGDAPPNDHQIQTTHALRLEIDSVNATIAALQHQSQQLKTQIAANATSVASRADQLDRQIAELEGRIATLTANPHGEELARITADIESLNRQIRSAVPTYVAASAPAPDNNAVLFEQLDEIDTQIARWRSVQNDVQAQRVQLKDEMVLWNEMTLESERHPYHKARKILLSLEKRVDHAESQSVQWLDAHGPIDSHQAAGFVNDVCKAMREDLYDLCDELGKQYQQIRHRSAAAELKRLRRCYEEITENVRRLLQRRNSVIEKIRQVDPAGAEAIVRADEKFCQCATHEGYFKARERFLGPIAAVTPAAQMVSPDLTQQRSQLLALENRRTELQRHGATDSLELTQLRSQVMNLRNQRNSLAPARDAQWKLELSRVENELHANVASLQSLNLRLEKATATPPATPNPILIEASQILTRLSHGQLSRVWLINDSDRAELQVQDRHQRVLSTSALSPTMRTQTELSLILAANAALAKQGVTSPLIIDELFGDFDSDRIDTALQCVAEFAARGHQVLMLTQHRFLIDRANNYGSVKFFDIENQATSARLIAPTELTPAATPNPQPVPPHPPATIAFSNAQTFTSNGAGHPLQQMLRPLAATVKPEFAAATETNHYQQSTVGHYESSQPSPVISPPVASIKADQIGDRLEYAVTFEEHSLLSEIAIFDSLQLRTFNESGIHSVMDLLNVDTERFPSHWNEAGLTRSVIENMQSEVWLLTCVPALRPYDAHVLVACGIFEPDQLETSAAHTLLERVQRYLNAHQSEYEFDDSCQITLNRINDWHKGIAKTRQRWRNGRRGRNRRNDQRRQTNGHAKFDRDGVGRSNRSPGEAQSRGPRLSRHDDGGSAPGQKFLRTDRSSVRSRDSHPTQSPRMPRTPRMASPTPESFRRSVPALAPDSNRTKETKPAATRTSPQSTKSNHKFYLDLEDHIEAAPSIGPKTAERFEKIGVFTIAEFLKQTAESMAAKLNYKRMSVDVVRSWQQQARLVCRIPNLRGHDAQLLVACEIIEPEEIASMQPQSLFRVIEPFSDTKEGLKIIRSGKKPDLAEITDWIAWAQHTRSLQAA